MGARCTRLRCIRGRVRGLIGWKRAAVASSRSMASPLSPKSLPWALRNLTSSLPLETQHALGRGCSSYERARADRTPPPAPQKGRFGGLGGAGGGWGGSTGCSITYLFFRILVSQRRRWPSRGSNRATAARFQLADLPGFHAPPPGFPVLRPFPYRTSEIYGLLKYTGKH